MDKINKCENMLPKEKMLIRPIKRIRTINGAIDDIQIFKNKNYLVKGHDNKFDHCLLIFDPKDRLAPDEIKIYNKSFHLIKRIIYKKNFDFFKIINDNTVICLGNQIELIKISLKEEIFQPLFFFQSKIHKLLYYKKNLIITVEERNNGIKIWQLLNNNRLKLRTKIINMDMYYKIIFLIKNKDIMVTPGYNNAHVTVFWNLKLCKIEKQIDYYLGCLCQLSEKIFVFSEKNDKNKESRLDIYDYLENKIIKNIDLDYKVKLIKAIRKKNIFLVAGGVISEDYYNHYDIHVYDYDFNQIQFIDRLHFRDIVGIELYERGEKEDDVIFSYSEDGSYDILKLCA